MYGKCHLKSASIDASFVKSRVVGAEKREAYKRGLIFLTIAGRAGWDTFIFLSSSSQADNFTPNVSFGTMVC